MMVYRWIFNSPTDTKEQQRSKEWRYLASTLPKGDNHTPPSGPPNTEVSDFKTTRSTGSSNRGVRSFALTSGSARIPTNGASYPGSGSANSEMHASTSASGGASYRPGNRLDHRTSNPAIYRSSSLSANRVSHPGRVLTNRPNSGPQNPSNSGFTNHPDSGPADHPDSHRNSLSGNNPDGGPGDHPDGGSDGAEYSGVRTLFQYTPNAIVSSSSVDSSVSDADSPGASAGALPGYHDSPEP